VVTSTNTGTVVVTASVQVPVSALKFKAGVTGTGNSYYYRDIMTYPYPYTSVTGDVLEYEIFIPAASSNKNGGVDIEFTDSSALRSSNVTDQNGVSAHPQTDLSAYAVDTWYYRRIPIPAGKTVSSIEMAHEGDAGVNLFYLRNVRIISSSGKLMVSAYSNFDSGFIAWEKVGPSAYGYPVNDGLLDVNNEVGIVQLSSTCVKSIMISAVPGPATTIVSTANPVSLFADGLSTTVVTAAVVDQFGNIVSGYGSQLTFSISGQAATWYDGTTSNKTVVPVSGVATIRIRSNAMSGQVTVTIIGPGVSASQSVINVTAGVATKILTAANPAGIIADGLSISTITATMVDDNNNLVPGSTGPVNFTITGQGAWEDGTVSTKTVSIQSGVATIRAKSTTKTGNFRVESNVP
jgi:hypothetical protein